MIKPCTELDVEVLVSEVLGGPKYVERYLEVYKEKGKPTAIVKPKSNYIPNTIWKQVHKRVKEMGGSWRRFQRFWEVLLVEKSVK